MVDKTAFFSHYAPYKSKISRLQDLVGSVHLTKYFPLPLSVSFAFSP